MWEESESQRVKNAWRTNAITQNAGRQVNAFQRALVKQPGTLVFGPIQRQPELRFSLAGLGLSSGNTQKRGPENGEGYEETEGVNRGNGTDPLNSWKGKGNCPVSQWMRKKKTE